MFIIIYLILFHVMVSLASLMKVSSTFFFPWKDKLILTWSAVLEILLFLIAGRRNYQGSDLRDKLARRHSPSRRYSPVRDARGRQMLRGQI